MAKYKIGILEGDDIGLEVVPAAVQAIDAAVEGIPSLEIEWFPLPVGYNSYLQCGETLPESTLQTLTGMDAWILGPVGHLAYPKDDPKAVNPHPIIRRHFNMHANIRPVRSHPAVKSLHSGVNLVIVRENNQGFQPDRNVHRGWGEFMPTPDMAVSVRIITRENSTFVARNAFELARRRGVQNKVTIIHKNTVFKMGCGLFVDCCREVAADYPDITCDEMIVDTFAARLVMRPQEFDVVVTTNMFGDILNDEAAAIVGGLGMAPGICVGENYIMAQATHGSAPDIAGRGIANPYAMIMSGAMMMAWLGQKFNDAEAVRAGEKISHAVDQALHIHEVLTPDLGGTGSTQSMAEAIIEFIGSSGKN